MCTILNCILKKKIITLIILNNLNILNKININLLCNIFFLKIYNFYFNINIYLLNSI